MFCTSLRKRVEWATVPSTLLASQAPKWKEQTLTTHDLAIPIPLPKTHQRDALETFLLLALSPTDLLDQPATMSRIQRLYHHTGGRNVGILFLLNGKTLKSNGTVAFMNLQLTLLKTLEIPLIPLSSLSTIQHTLSAFQCQLVSKRRADTIPQHNPAVSLLPYCTNNPPLPEHARNVLSDLYHSIPEIASVATSVEGKRRLRQWLEDSCPGVADDVVEFWAQEIFVD
ncbi:hypothetical protein MBM_06179 [Drepanopeziza brunnea f. sp. 'multigermtubi' MB_m1]|uniref:Uncharacterized protein n=1 Tax=Marssonina brunnea f. sp. multigermtubi (strain MB_m1) TaxID=1072389 RepID=K1WR94_MARBU|nr:uncharacterized protein MBM_06179 [Drepanopeziza brunnea f. sp. 'multigermtubi' MB_m1]EKD15551.1 hypothetical protein MBM_06179 [Drepanopeziza brunnea f. sp. 'multigermtubi' MB_m1]